MRTTKLILTLVLITFTLAACSKSNDPVNPEPEIVTPTYPKPKAVDNNVIAHRGASKEYGHPDNSTASLKAAISLGCFASECDIHITKDKQVVVFHDDTFNGLTFKDATYAELCATGTLPNGERLPLFGEYLDVVLKAGTTKLLVDVKSMSDTYGGDTWSILAAQAASAIVHEKHAKNFVEFIAGREAVLTKCIEASRGDWACGYMNTAVNAGTFYSKGYSWANFTISAFYQKESVIQSFKNYNIRVSTYNADTEAEMTWFLAQNLYAVCTNYPAKLLQLVRSK